MPSKTRNEGSGTPAAGVPAQGHSQADSELADLLVLQRISSELINEQNTETLYER